MELERRVKKLEQVVNEEEGGYINILCGYPSGEPLPCSCGKLQRVEDLVPPDFKGTIIGIIDYGRETLDPPCQCGKDRSQGGNSCDNSRQ